MKKRKTNKVQDERAFKKQTIEWTSGRGQHAYSTIVSEKNTQQFSRTLQQDAISMPNQGQAGPSGRLNVQNDIDTRMMDAPEPPQIDGSASATEPEKKRTQNSQLLHDFEEGFDLLQALLMKHSASPNIGLPCHCGKGLRTTKCADCPRYGLSCEACYVKAHRGLPYHWAKVWVDQGYFIRRDISMLDGGTALHLGHEDGQVCPNPGSKTDLMFTVVHTNGIHGTKVRFCHCNGTPHKVTQLMDAQLFPGTMNDPHTAFTFQLLNEFHKHHLESKKAAYDYLGAIKRLTDGAFTADVIDPYANFLRVTRVWRYLKMRIRTGQALGISTHFPHRPPGYLNVYCPRCPEADVNMEAKWQNTPESLKHLNQLAWTADGNHQCNKQKKNSDPDDVSLCEGKAYFPRQDEYSNYLKTVPVTKDKSTCSYLSVVNKQDRKKFKNMDITGVVNIQCNHVNIMSTVDLQYGERFANTDFALAHALRCRRHGRPCDFKDNCDHLQSYDCNCQYCVNAVTRFEDYLPDCAASVKRMRWSIPALHIQGHKDDCMYMYSTAYMSSGGHFHGETAEFYWNESNQLGPHTRQMNNGHRQDTLIDHHSDWNWKKTMKASTFLYNEVQNARALYHQKREHFRGLTALYADRVDNWDQLSRETTVEKGVIISCYHFRKSKLPSQKAIYEQLLAKDAKPSMLDTEYSSVAVFLNEGLGIQAAQRKLKFALASEPPPPASEIESRRTKLRARISKWRRRQKELMQKAGDFVQRQKECEPEDEILFLPSELSGQERVDVGVIDLAAEEGQLRQGQAFDALRSVKAAAQAMATIRMHRKKQDRGQTANTRSLARVKDMESKRDLGIQDYSVARKAMITLGVVEEHDTNSMFPALTIDDTCRKSTVMKRGLGDSRKVDGKIWTQGGVTSGTSIALPPGTSLPAAPVDEVIGTQMPRRRAPPVRARRQDKEKPPNAVTLPPVRDGWIWSYRGQGKMTEADLEDWMDEDHRVQWFRAEAEMQRWQEELEIKQAEFLRCIRSFCNTKRIWTLLANSQPTDLTGNIAYARRTSAMYARMERECREKLIAVGYGHLLKLEENGEILADEIARQRQKEAKLFADDALARQALKETAHEDTDSDEAD